MITLVRPNGLVERLPRRHDPDAPFNGYGRSQPGPTSPEILRVASDRDRRGRRRQKPDPLRGRLVDVTA